MQKHAELIVSSVIKKRRKELKKSAKDMAAALNVHIRKYWRMEKGHLRASEVEAICSILDLDIMYVPKENI